MLFFLWWSYINCYCYNFNFHFPSYYIIFNVHFYSYFILCKYAYIYIYIYIYINIYICSFFIFMLWWSYINCYCYNYNFHFPSYYIIFNVHFLAFTLIVNTLSLPRGFVLFFTASNASTKMPPNELGGKERVAKCNSILNAKFIACNDLYIVCAAKLQD